MPLQDVSVPKREIWEELVLDVRSHLTACVAHIQFGTLFLVASQEESFLVP